MIPTNLSSNRLSKSRSQQSYDIFSSVYHSKFPPTNNQLRTSSNPRTQATIQNGQVLVQNVQGTQSQSYAGNAGNNQALGSRVINAVGNIGANQPRFKENMLLAQAQEAKFVLDEEQHDFLADSLEETNDFKAAVLSEAQWNSDEGDVSKPRSFERHMSKSTKQHPRFYNNDYTYLVNLSTEEKYTTSITKHYIARYYKEGIEDTIPKIWSKEVHRYHFEALNDLRIKSVIRIVVKKKCGYGFLTSIIVRRSNDKEYEFSYADLPRLSVNDVEDMYLLQLSEVKKFSDGTLVKIQENSIDMLSKNKLGRDNKRLKGRDRTDYDVKSSKEMLKKIDEVLRHREQLRRLEEYVGGRPKTINFFDFKKAFDSIRWDYLQDILKMFGFGDKWCGWINGCLNSTMGSVLVNGSPASEFQFHKGLKQGDPLSPFLFILIMESLHLSFSKVKDAGLFLGIPIGSSLTISHLFFEDDDIFVGKWDSLSIRTIVNVLKCFHLASGLKIKFHKSKLMEISTRPEEVDAATTTMGCSTFTIPFVHVGVKVGGAMSRIKYWYDVVAKVSSRLSKKKLKTLRIGGRLTLIKSLLTSIPLYHMFVFKVPSGVLKLLESIRRNFFNGVDGSERKMAWISWNKVLASKKYDGLGVSSFYALNRALLFKWVWPFFSHGSCLWTTFIKAIYSEDNALNSSSSLGGVEEEQLGLLLSRMDGLILTNIPDRWVWSLEATSEFSVKFVRQLIDDSILLKEEVATKWVKVMPIKINVFAWRVRFDKLPTRLNLSLKGIDISSIVSPLCHASVEFGSQIFFSCPMARQLWRKFMRWWELEDIDLASYDYWLLWLNSSRLSKRLKEILEGVCYVKWWLI
uniref:RNA-directed DNA polymerase, eukaryota n=1 Tax=Tanacetum cinerariifolium TaxID=118510 RepID=A0A6L2JTB9_TANCI|nr:RNA-directed DNA polymerase, eukaryota [Tanacetum cinerariifolium]